MASFCLSRNSYLFRSYFCNCFALILLRVLLLSLFIWAFPICSSWILSKRLFIVYKNRIRQKITIDVFIRLFFHSESFWSCWKCSKLLLKHSAWGWLQVPCYWHISKLSSMYAWRIPFCFLLLSLFNLFPFLGLRLEFFFRFGLCLAFLLFFDLPGLLLLLSLEFLIDSLHGLARGLAWLRFLLGRKWVLIIFHFQQTT